MQIYVIKENDTLDSISSEQGADAAEVAFVNQIPYPYRLAIGQALLIPVNSSEAEKRSVSVNGYAYPFISAWVLEQTLPYLTELSIFSYGFTAEGELLPPARDDAWMISLARSYGVLPVLTLTPLDAEGRFNNNLVTAVTNNMEAQENLIGQLIFTMEQDGFRGLNLDFEYILPQDRLPYVEFVRNVTASLSPLGYPVSVALAPKTSAEQEGLLYEGHDYRLLGEAADSVLLMTYEWGYTLEHSIRSTTPCRRRCHLIGTDGCG